MLNNVPQTINSVTRNVVLKHPNTMDCTIYRKQLNRYDTDTIGGLPTVAGLTMLASDDEPDYEYVEVGDGKVLFTGQFMGGANNTIDTDDGIIYAEAPIEALIEFIDADNVPDKTDMVMVYPAAEFVLAYEVVGVTSNTSIPPYTRKYMLVSRQDANVGI